MQSSGYCTLQLYINSGKIHGCLSKLQVYVFNYFKYSGTPWSIMGHKSQAVLINNVHVFKCFLNEKMPDRVLFRS